jgi:glutamate-1-semialdehyde 2,1-aminomutase
VSSGADRSDQPGAIDRRHLRALITRELDRYCERNPGSARRSGKAREHMLAGVPMSWMLKWAGANPIAGDPTGFPLFATRATGSRLVDVDGHEYVDFCLGDTGAMAGHSPAALVEPLAAQLDQGLTYMLPTDAVIDAAELLTQRFGLPIWQFTVSATDANRFAIRLARALSGRSRVLVFNCCYHGTVDESLATIGDDGTAVGREWNLGAPVPLDETTRVVEFNDLEALERELANGDVACVLTEPALTNVGIVLPAPGFHDAMRELATKSGTLLILDETHTICAGPGGCTRELGLEPDLITIGKAIGGGVPAGAWGMTAELSERVQSDPWMAQAMVEGIGTGGTLAGNALSARAITITLRHLLGPEAFEHMKAMARRWREGVERIIDEHGLAWHVTQLGARAEYHFTSRRPQNGSELAAVGDEELERFLRLYLINRGILTTPFHNMALMGPETSADDVALHEHVLGEAVADLVAGTRAGAGAVGGSKPSV